MLIAAALLTAKFEDGASIATDNQAGRASAEVYAPWPRGFVSWVGMPHRGRCGDGHHRRQRSRHRLILGIVANGCQKYSGKRFFRTIARRQVLGSKIVTNPLRHPRHGNTYRLFKLVAHHSTICTPVGAKCYAKRKRPVSAPLKA